MILTADTHIGSTVGLCTPIVRRDNADDWRASPPVRWTWRYWLDFWEGVKERTAGMRRVWVSVGDTVDFNVRNGRTNQYISNFKPDVMRAAIETLEPGSSIADDIYIIRGTDAHEGVDCEFAEWLAHDIGAKPDPDNGNEAWWHLCGTLAGLKIDIAHSTSMGSLPWTDKNAANKLAIQTMNHYVVRNERPPDLVVRAHVHRTADSYDNYSTRAIILPCWQLITSYGYKRNPNRYPDIGGVLVVIRDGRIVDVWKQIEKFSQKTRRPWARQL